AAGPIREFFPTPRVIGSAVVPSSQRPPGPGRRLPETSFPAGNIPWPREKFDGFVLRARSPITPAAHTRLLRASHPGRFQILKALPGAIPAQHKLVLPSAGSPCPAEWTDPKQLAGW